MIRQWDVDFYWRSPRTDEARISSARCVDCDRWVVDAYLCYECAIQRADLRSDDERAPTATQIGRATQLLVDRSAAYEQFRQLQTVNDQSVQTIGDSEESSRSRRIHRMRVINQASGFTHEEFATANEILGPVMIVAFGRLEYADRNLRHASREAPTKV